LTLPPKSRQEPPAPTRTSTPSSSGSIRIHRVVI
jgi:hypothetical protein